MTQVNFPSNPSNGREYTVNDVTYTWNGTYWEANNASSLYDRFVNVDGDTMTGDLTVPSLNGGPLAGLRNLLINGATNIDQRNAGWVANGYGPDRWFSYSNNVQITKSRITDLPGFTYALSVRNTGGNNTPKAISQAVELIDSTNATTAPFVENGTYTLSWWCKQRNGSAMTAANITSKSFNFRNGMTDTANASSGLSSTAVTQIGSHGNWRRFATTVTIDQAANANNACLTVRIGAFEGTELSSSDGVFYTGLQLEPGPVATPFEHRPVGLELDLCKRYYQKVNFRSVIFNAANSTNNCYINAPAQDMRVKYSNEGLTISPGVLLSGSGRFEGNPGNNASDTINGWAVQNGYVTLQIPRKGSNSSTPLYRTVGGNEQENSTFILDAEL